MSSPPPVPDEAPWQAGLHSARRLVRPGLALQATALALVCAYYFVPAAHGAFVALTDWSNRGGYAFAAAVTAVCGGLLPFLFLRLNPATRRIYPWPHLIFFMLFWGWKGAEVNLFYRSLAALFGDAATPGVILRKVLADQFVYNPFYAAPLGNLCFAWKDARFRWAPVAADLRAGGWYGRSVLPVLLCVWLVWGPAVACVYALPQPLQLPLFNVVLCFWSLLFAHLTARQNLGR